ncbi:MAG: FliI/YscN family ATPase [Betaproteobacteria bacterium]|nr:FliI/YscN family ATPase [Betaproteobacteria bacterium]
MNALRLARLFRPIGWVCQLQGLAIQADGPSSRIGEFCEIRLTHSGQTGAEQRTAASVLAEVVAVRGERITLMPYGSLQGIAAGDQVLVSEEAGSIPVGSALLGRVVDCFGRPLDALGEILSTDTRGLHGDARNPLHRPKIKEVLETGVRVIDSLLTLGKGQRIGIFSGSGVGKSVLLGMIARHVQADVNVIALIGERGREVREFIDQQLGPDGLARSVVVVASSDQPALSRIRAAQAAVAIAEHFREQGKDVLLTMDSITRLAMARREVGLSAGEPPTARGYTPSVFAELPGLCERCGTSDSGGSITALFTVLVEGDDLNEPVADALRSILDGHVVLSRELAHQGHYPAVDVLKSTSRLMRDVASEDERALQARAVRLLALLERNRAMVEIGAYQKGTNTALDLALEREAGLRAWLCQSAGGAVRCESLEQLHALLAGWELA